MPSLGECDGKLYPQFCVLVVEDESLIRMDVVEELEAAGLLVVEAASADEAVDYLKSSEKVDLVFTDREDAGRSRWAGISPMDQGGAA